jgi:aminoglycoside phosphotransferase (APT) family kinase protein
MAWPGAYFQPPTQRALRWVEHSVGRGSKVIRARRLGGGSSSAVHAVDVRRRSGQVSRLVLRRHLLFSWLADEPDLAEKEARTLQLLERNSIAAPRLVAVDPDGGECDVPALLMTRIPGHLDLDPREIDPWLHRMAELLPPIHAIEPGSVHVQAWRVWAEDDVRTIEPPDWTQRGRDWARLIEIARGPWPAYRPRFVHRDFQHYNVLWSRGRPTGLLDWIDASMAPVELDFGHFRRNLVTDFGFDVAERFLDHYRAVTGEEPNPFWEALNLSPAWAKTGRQQADTDAYAASLVAKLT